MATKVELTTPERSALLKVRKVAGPRWKAALRKAWTSNGKTPTLADLVYGMPTRQAAATLSALAALRTKIGPRGLAKVRLDGDC